MRQIHVPVQEVPLSPLSLWPIHAKAVPGFSAFRGTTPRRSMREIAERVAERWGTSVVTMRYPTRVKHVAYPRQEAMALMHEEGFSHHQIVRFFGLKDHTTSVHACKAVKARALAKQEAA